MKKTLLAIALLLMVNSVVFAQTEKKPAIKAQPAAPTQMQPLIKEGDKCPDFTFETINGDSVSISDLKGKYVLIDIWATWCPPCLKEITFLQKLEEKMEGEKIHFLAVSVDNERRLEQWKTMVKDRKLGGIQARAGAKNREFSELFGAEFIPHFVLLDKKGKVIQVKMKLRPSSPNDEMYNYLISLKGI